MRTLHPTCSAQSIVPTRFSSFAAILVAILALLPWHRLFSAEEPVEITGPLLQLESAPALSWVNPNDPYFNIPEVPGIPSQLLQKQAHRYFLVLDSGEWTPLTLEINLDASWIYDVEIDSRVNENGETESLWSLTASAVYSHRYMGQIAVPANGFAPETKYWVCDSDTGLWSDARYAIEGLCASEIVIPGSGVPEQPAKVFPGDLYVLKKASVSSDLSVKGTARVFPRGNLSMGEFQNGPRP